MCTARFVGPVAWALTAIVVALGVFYFYLFGAAPFGFVGLDLRDDAWYYLEIARNAAQGYPSTFDRLHATNGYHPLWLWVLIPVAHVFTDPESFLFAAGMCFGLFWAGTGALLFALLGRDGARPLAALAPILWIFATPLTLYMLLESALSAFLITATCLAVVGLGADAGAPSRKPVLRGALSGALLGLAVLARLDNVLLAVPCLVYVLWRGAGELRERVQVVGAAFVVAALIVAPYLVSNQVQFGSPTPVSGERKHASAELQLERLGGRLSPEHSALAAGIGGEVAELVGEPVTRWMRPAWRALGGDDGPTLPLAIAGMVAMLWVLPIPGLSRRRALDVAGPLWAFALLHFAFYTVLYYTEPAAWYWVPESLSVVVLLALSAERGVAGMLALVTRATQHRFVERVLRGAGVLGILLPALAFADGSLRLQWQERDVVPSRAAAGQWIHENLPPEARGAGWNAGFVGYFYRGPFINLDGLVNSPDFDERTRDGVMPYLCEEGVEYLIDFRSEIENKALPWQRFELVAELPFAEGEPIIVFRLPAGSGGRWYGERQAEAGTCGFPSDVD